jgi:aryl-alcohol dehydrogenase-like predicted oxidoreductase
LTRLPEAVGKLIPGLRSDGQRAIQFVRSTPGVLTSLVGMKRRAHVEENLALTRLPTLSPDQVAQLFARTGSR